MTRLVLFLLGLAAVAAVPLTAQEPTPRFEVASIKPTRSAETGTVISQNEGRQFVAENITLSNLLQQAYDVYPFQIVGVPAWVERDRFDIRAITAPNTTRVQQAALLRQLLEDRFMVRTRREMRERDVYSLVIAREDKRLGPNLRPFTGDCTAPPGGQSPCRMRNGPNFTDAVGNPSRASLVRSRRTWTDSSWTRPASPEDSTSSMSGLRACRRRMPSVTVFRLSRHFRSSLGSGLSTTAPK